MSKVRCIIKAKQSPTKNSTEFDGSISNKQLQAFLISISLPRTGDKQAMMDRIVAWSSQLPAVGDAATATTTSHLD